MHELWLCKSILNIVHEQLKGTPIKHVKKIVLEVGALLNVEPSVLAFNFEVIALNTKAEGAELVFITLPGKAICDACKRTVHLAFYAETCHHCGHFHLTITQGEELRVKSMEVA